MMKRVRAFGLTALAMSAMFGWGTAPARAECYEEVPLRPVHRSFIRRDVQEPGVYEIARRPALYGWVHEKVYNPDGTVGYVSRRILLRPYKNIAHFQPPYIAYTREHLRVQPEGSRLVRVRGHDC